MTSGKKAALIGCGCLGLAALGLCIALGVWFSLAVEDPEGLRVSIGSPTDVSVGQTFDLAVELTNERPNKAFRLSDIDISYDYLDGFVVVSTEPSPKSSEDNAPRGRYRPVNGAVPEPIGTVASSSRIVLMKCAPVPPTWANSPVPTLDEGLTWSNKTTRSPSRP